MNLNVDVKRGFQVWKALWGFAALFTVIYFVFYAKSWQTLVSDVEYEPLPVIDLIIKPTPYRKIQKKRNDAIKTGFLISDETDYVPASLRANGKKLRAKIRLKGDLGDHFAGKKWSFRISLKDGALFGLRKFSLQSPETRHFLAEWVLQKAFQAENLFHLRMQFVDLRVNGKRMGVYHLEEHFDNVLIANAHHREGLILRYDESLIWEKRFRFNYGTTEGWIRDWASWHRATITPYQEKKVTSDPNLLSQFKIAHTLLESVRREEASLSDVFDVTSLATSFALIDIFGGQHGTLFTNTRFYFNPLTQKLHWVPFDHDALSPHFKPIGQIFHEIQQGFPETGSPIFKIWGDKKLAKTYISELERVTSESYLNGLFGSIKKELERNMHFIRLEYEDYVFPSNVLKRNVNMIRATLRPESALLANISTKSRNGTSISCSNRSEFPIEVTGLLSGKNKIESNPVVLWPPPKMSSNEYVDISFKNAVDLKPLKVVYRTLGTTTDFTAAVSPVPWLRKEERRIVLENINKTSNIAKFPFLKADKSGIRVKPGSWRITESVLIPKGTTLIIEGGTTLDFDAGAKLISHSAIRAIGTPDLPVKINGSKDTAILVSETEKRSLLSNVIFSGFSVTTSEKWGATGAVTFYEAPVDIENSRFLNMKTEDGLNLVRTDFKIRDTLFANCSGDALDIDFSKGVIAKSRFIGSGNDGIDISGSQIRIMKVEVRSAGDKAISVGEKSEVMILKSFMTASNIGVASKDASRVYLDYSRITDSHIGLAAYEKKAEFGPGFINSVKSQLSGIKNKYVIGKKSRIQMETLAMEYGNSRHNTALLNKIRGELQDG